ncbi:MAG: hypothetical protein EBR10_11305 [Planctomycetes bacterium]|nr:hypothetical protein [Planctomycetota bacterium]
MSRTIFLDIDGVLNSREYLISLPKPEGLIVEANIEHHIDPVRVERLNKIGGAIVISSTWRLFHSHVEIGAMLERRGLRSRSLVLGATPDLGNRGDEITHWVSRRKLDRFVVLDDTDDGLKQFGRRFIHVRDGLEDAHVERAIELLRRRP